MSNAVPSPEELMLELRFAQRLALRLVRDHHIADDVAQEAILAALQRPDVHAQKKRAWLVGVVRNLVHNRARDGRRRTERETRYIQDSGDDAIVETSSPAQEALQRGEQKARIAALVMDLPEPYRTVIVLRYMEEFSPPDIAEKLGRPVETVKTQLRRGMAKLRDELDAASGGDGTTWALALLPLVAPRFPLASSAAAASGSASGTGSPTSGGAGAATAKASSAWGAGLATFAVVAAGALAVLGWQKWHASSPDDGRSEAPALAEGDFTGSDTELASGGEGRSVPLVPLAPPTPRRALATDDADRGDGGALATSGAALHLDGPDEAGVEEELPSPMVEVVDANSNLPIPGASIHYVAFSTDAWDVPEGEADLPEGEGQPLPRDIEEKLKITESFIVSTEIMLDAEEAMELGGLDDSDGAMAASEEGGREFFHSVVTDAAGAASLADAQGKTVYVNLQCEAEGYAREDRFIDWREGQGPIRVALRRPAAFTLQRGAIDPRASVVVTVSDMVQKLCGVVTMEPGEDSFEVSDLPPGVYSLGGMALVPGDPNAPQIRFRDLVVRTSEGGSTVLNLWKAERPALLATLVDAEPGDALRLRVSGRYLTGRVTLDLPFVNGEVVAHDLGGPVLQAEVLQGDVRLLTEAIPMPPAALGPGSRVPLKHAFTLHAGGLRIVGGELTLEPDVKEFRYALAEVGAGSGAVTAREGVAPVAQLADGIQLDHLPPGRFELWWSLGLRTGRVPVAVGAGESTVTLGDSPVAVTGVTLKVCDCVFLGSAISVYSAAGARVPLDLAAHLDCCAGEESDDDHTSVEIFLPQGDYVARWTAQDLAGDQHAFTVGLQPSTATLHSAGDGALATLNFINGDVGGEVLIARVKGESGPGSESSEGRAAFDEGQGHLVMLNADRLVRLVLAPGQYEAKDVQGRVGTFEVSAAQPTAYVEMR